MGVTAEQPPQSVLAGTFQRSESENHPTSCDTVSGYEDAIELPPVVDATGFCDPIDATFRQRVRAVGEVVHRPIHVVCRSPERLECFAIGFLHPPVQPLIVQSSTLNGAILLHIGLNIFIYAVASQGHMIELSVMKRVDIG